MRTQQIGFVAALAVGCLLSLQAASGCSSGTDNNTPPDAGTTTHPDAGTTHPDAGTTTVDHTIGGGCTMAADAGQQGDCATGLSCLTDARLPGGLCSKPCTADADCGTGNTCVDIGQGKACFRACDPGVIGSCGRTDWVCQPTGANSGLCNPSCKSAALAGDCGSDQLACQADGTCTTAAGSSGAYESCGTENCQAGLDCLSFQGGSGDPICFPDCTSAACPAGSQCAIGVSNSTTKACTKECSTDADCVGGFTCQTSGGKKICLPPQPAGTQQPYQACGGANGACVDTAGCLSTAGAASGVCFTDCTASAAACGGGQTCNITAGTSKFCGQPCTGTGQSTCPTGTTCKSSICLP
jgi:hypothetical protein